MTMNYIDPNPESGKIFYRDFNGKGKVVMLNLLKFRKFADYTGFKLIKPEKEISGKEAYQLYMKSILPILTKAGSRILYFGKSQNFLIGPESQKWDAIILVEHQSVSKFMEFAQSGDYLKKAGHRKAAIEDSRLLPSKEIKSLV